MGGFRPPTESPHDAPSWASRWGIARILPGLRGLGPALPTLFSVSGLPPAKSPSLALTAASWGI